jgi:anti-sigma factor RsiW
MLLVDGELPPARDAQVRAWLAGDPASAAKVASLRLAGRAVREAAAARPSPADAIADAVLARIGHEAPPGLAPRRARAVLGAGVGLAAAAAAALCVQRGAPPEPMASLATTASADPATAEGGDTVVDEVDFGARSGTVFFVPAGTATTTAVVWVDEDGPSAGEAAGEAR